MQWWGVSVLVGWGDSFHPEIAPQDVILWNGSGICADKKGDDGYVKMRVLHQLGKTKICLNCWGERQWGKAAAGWVRAPVHLTAANRVGFGLLQCLTSTGSLTAVSFGHLYFCSKSSSGTRHIQIHIEITGLKLYCWILWNTKSYNESTGAF